MLSPDGGFSRLLLSAEGWKNEIKALHGRMHDGRMFSGRLTLSTVFYMPEGDGRAAAALAFRTKVQTKKTG